MLADLPAIGYLIKDYSLQNKLIIRKQKLDDQEQEINELKKYQNIVRK